MPIDLPPPLIVPDKPAIIQAAPKKLLKPKPSILFPAPFILSGSAPYVTLDGAPQTNTDNTNQSSDYTWSSVNIGAASSDRYVVVLVAYKSSEHFFTCSIGGAFGIGHIQATNGDHKCAVFSRNVTSGTSIDIVFDPQSTTNGYSAAAYTVRAPTGYLLFQRFQFFSSASATSTSLSSACPLQAGDAFILCRALFSTTGSRNVTWTLGTGSEDFDDGTAHDELANFSGASGVFDSASSEDGTSDHVTDLGDNNVWLFGGTLRPQ